MRTDGVLMCGLVALVGLWGDLGGPLGPAPALAQGTFPLKYQAADKTDELIQRVVPFYRRALPERPSDLEAAPQGLSERARYYSIPICGRQVLMVLDAPPAPRLFVDAAGTKDLSRAQPLTAMPLRRGWIEQVFGPVAITGADPSRSARAWFLIHEGNTSSIRTIPAGYMVGEVELGGQSYRVAVVDPYVSGRYDHMDHITGDRQAHDHETYLAVDLNQDGRFEMPTAAGEVVQLLPALHVEDAYYGVTVAPDGSSISLAKTEPKFGTLDTQCPGLGLYAICEYGFQDLARGDGKWRVPVGWHEAGAKTLTRRDAAGAAWMAYGPSWRGAGKLDLFEVRPGDTSTVAMGPPLMPKVQAEPATDGVIRLSLSFVGRGGEGYHAQVEKNGQPVPPPRFRILDDSGKVLAAGQFEYG